MVFISQIIDKYGKFQICKISTYLFYLNYEFINSSIALNSLDRFFSLKYPLDFKFRKTFKFYFLISFLNFIFSAIAYSPLLYFISNADNCNINDEKHLFWFSTGNFIISIIIPFTTMTVCTCLVGHHLLKEEKNLEREKKLFKILVSMDIYFFICHFPHSLNIILGSLSFLSIYSISNILILDFGYIFLFIHNSSTFFVLFYSSIQFKNYCYSVLGFHRQNNQRIAPIIGSFIS